VKDFRTIFYILILFFFSGKDVLAQSEDLSPKQLIRMAHSAEEYNDYHSAIFYYNKYNERKPGEIKVLIALANNYKLARDYSNALIYYKLANESSDNKDKLVPFYYAKMLKANGKCQEAIPVFESFRKSYRGEKEDSKYLRLAKNNAIGCRELTADTSLLYKNIEQLGNDINGIHMEASPIYLDENNILFNSLKIEGENSFALNTDSLPKREFYLAKRNKNKDWVLKGKWSKSPNLENTQLANGAFNLEKTRFYFSGCKTSTTAKINCDIYVLDLKASEVKVEKLPSTINTKYTETQVAVGKDYKNREVVYFVSDRKEGKGGLDLWYTTYDEKKKIYKTPRNCGSKINTVGDEMTPFINPRNRNLFYSSDGLPGFGELDVFKAAGERSKWAEPTNLGDKVNSPNDELYYVESKKGGTGFLVSNRKGKFASNNSTCCDDIFSFMDSESKVHKISLNSINDNGDNKALDEVELMVYEIDEMSGEKFLVQSYVIKAGVKTELFLDDNKEFLVVAKKEGYFNQEKKLSTKNARSLNDFSFSIDMEKISNQSIVIDNIYYKFDKSELTEDAMLTIDTTIYPIMINNPSIVVEISSHTDGRGTEGYNKKLSQDRAESVVKYLRKKGIRKDRMKAKGYGKGFPIAANTNKDGSDNPEGRAKNRRTEFKVIGKVEVFEEED
jgi:outer membrane protein OmpA-like peptidoglycan-associated protein